MMFLLLICLAVFRKDNFSFPVFSLDNYKLMIASTFTIVVYYKFSWMLFVFINCKLFFVDMNPSNLTPSFLKFLNEDNFIFLVMFFTFLLPLGSAGHCIFTEDWIKLVRDCCLKTKDAVLLKAIGSLSFMVSCFKENLIADKFWKEFYGKNYKYGIATIYIEERFWNVTMKGWTDGCGFTDGWLKVIEEVLIPLESWLVFTMIAIETFELFVFHPTGTESFFKKADVVVLDDLVYGDDGFDLLIASVGDGLLDSKVAPLIHESDVKSVPQDHSVKIIVDINDPQVRSKYFSVHDTLASPSVVSNVEKMHNLHGKTIAQGKQAVHRLCKIQKLDLVSSTSERVLHFTKQAEHMLHLPSDVLSALDLHTDNLKPVKIQNLKGEV
ncbi:hypothetical protein Hanom_Chr04g00356221 [Helianthus anomalus]